MRVGRGVKNSGRSVQRVAVVGLSALIAIGGSACSSSATSAGVAASETSTISLDASSPPTPSSAGVATAPDSAPTSVAPATKSSTTLPTTAVSTTAVSTTSAPITLLSTTELPTAESSGLPNHLADLTIRVDEVVEFDAGSTSIVIDGGVIRGERDVYRVGAAKGQSFEVRIVAVEDNAVYDLFAPDGTLLATEASASRTTLPVDGVYIIVVGGMRGNAQYELTISIPA